MTNTMNPLPRFEALDENFASLPLHLMDIQTHACIYCGSTPTWDSYAEYIDDYGSTYEGYWLSGPFDPETEESFDYFAATCAMAD